MSFEDSTRLESSSRRHHHHHHHHRINNISSSSKTSYPAPVIPRTHTMNSSSGRSDYHTPSSSLSSKHGFARRLPYLYSRDSSRRSSSSSGQVISEHQTKSKSAEYHTPYVTGHDLLRMLGRGRFEEGLTDEFKVMINMVRHINALLPRINATKMAATIPTSVVAAITAATWVKINDRALQRGQGLAMQVMHYFDRLGKGLRRQINKIVEVKAYLPSLGPLVRPALLRTALRIWNERIIKYVYHAPPPLFGPFLYLPCHISQTLNSKPIKKNLKLTNSIPKKNSSTLPLSPPRPREKQLLTSFANFYFSQITTFFPPNHQLQVQQRNPPTSNPNHSLPTAINLIEHARNALETLIHETRNLSLSMHLARKRLTSPLNPACCIRIHRQDRTFGYSIAKLSKTTNEVVITKDNVLGMAAALRTESATATATAAAARRATAAKIPLREYFSQVTAALRKKTIEAKIQAETRRRESESGRGNGSGSGSGRDCECELGSK